MDDSFADLLAANKRYSISFPHGFDGIAHAGVAVVTCMDSRLEPLEMVGLYVGEAKILRTPGGHVTADALVGCVLGVHLLRVNRILIVQHTRCAMAAGNDADIRARILDGSGLDIGDMVLGADPAQRAKITADVATLHEHPLIKGRAQVGGFLYDVDTGLLEQVA